MKPYWDSGALVKATSDTGLETRLIQEGGFTRAHALTEVFSTLTGKMQFRVEPKAAAKTVRQMAGRLEFVNISELEILDALDQAQARGVRGGRVHDYIHAIAAGKAKAGALLTTDRNDFDGLIPGLKIEQV